MDIKNLKRSVSAKEELERFDKALTDFTKFIEKQETGRLGFLIAAHSDCSGDCIQYQYKDGNFHPMYVEILEFAQNKFKEARAELIAEIESL